MTCHHVIVQRYTYSTVYQWTRVTRHDTRSQRKVSRKEDSVVGTGSAFLVPFFSLLL